MASRNEDQEKQSFDSSRIAGKYLTFALANERYGLQILKVQEIIGVIKITKVPKAPDYMKGVINLRGKIIPVIDLRTRLGMPEKEYDEKTCFVVVNLLLEGQSIAVGVVVDTVLEVVDFDASSIQPLPDVGDAQACDILLGLGKTAEHVVILIDIDRVLADSSLLAHI